MPGTFIFRPIEANLAHGDLLGSLDPYCKFTIGWHSAESSVAKDQGKHPHWGDTITLERKHDEHSAKLVVKDKDHLSLDDNLGEVEINLDTILSKGRTTQWYELTHSSKPAGQVLVDIEYVGGY